MDGLNIQALRGFSLKCHSAVKEKSHYVCNTDKGRKAVQKVYTSHEHILFQHQVKETLYQNGFRNTDRFILASNGAPYVIIDNELYVATDYFSPEYREVDFRDKEAFLAAVATVARMHSILKDSGIGNLSVCMYVNKEEDIDCLYNKYISELRAYKKTTQRQPRLSDFDVMFIKSYDFYTDELTKWRELARTKEYAGVLEEGYSNCYVCHNLLKEETLLKASSSSTTLISSSSSASSAYFPSGSGGEIFVTNFSECSISHYIRDLSSMIKRYLKQSTGEQAQLSEIIDRYSGINPLTNAELTALRALLVFPDKFLKLCSRYYSKKRTWIPAAFMQRMTMITANKDWQADYVDSFFC